MRTWIEQKAPYQAKPKTETMRKERSPTMCLQQQNQKEEGLRKRLKRSIQRKKVAPTSAVKKRNFKKNSSEAKGLKQE